MFLKGILALSLLLTPYLAHAGAWTLPTAKWQSYHDFIYYSTDYYYDAYGDRFDQPRYRKVEQGSRFEYGWSDDLTAGLSFSLAAVEGTKSFFFGQQSQFTTPIRVDVTLWNYGIADPKLYLRHRLWHDDEAVISAQATLKFPSFFEHANFPRTGSDKFSYEMRFLAGHNFNWFNGSQFGNLETAYEFRPHNSGDLIHADASFGWELDDNWMILPQVFSTWRTGDGSNRFTQSGDDSYDLIKPQLSAIYQLNQRIGLQVGAFHHAYARNSGGGSGIIVGLWVTP